MGTLHLNGTLKLSGSLILGDKVTVDGTEAVVVAFTATPHSMSAPPPVPPPKPDDPLIGNLWVTISPNTRVTVKERAVAVDRAECIQGTAMMLRVLKAGDCKVTIDDAAVMVEATIDGNKVAFANSGQT